MNYFGRFLSNVRDFYMEMNAATLTGAIDVIAIEKPDGEISASPFHVRFGKASLLYSREKVVDIRVNDEPVELQMKLGESGEAFFVVATDLDEEEIPPNLATSPIPSSMDLMRQGVQDLRDAVEIGPNSSAYQNSSSDDNRVRRCLSEEAFLFEPEIVGPLTSSTKNTDSQTMSFMLGEDETTDDNSDVFRSMSQSGAKSDTPGHSEAREPNHSHQFTSPDAELMARELKKDATGFGSKKLKSKKQRDKDLKESKRRKMESLRRVQSWAGPLCPEGLDPTDGRKPIDRSQTTTAADDWTSLEQAEAEVEELERRKESYVTAKSDRSNDNSRRASYLSMADGSGASRVQSSKGKISVKGMQTSRTEDETIFSLDDVLDTLHDSSSDLSVTAGNDGTRDNSSDDDIVRNKAPSKTTEIHLPMSSTESEGNTDDEPLSATDRGFSSSLPRNFHSNPQRLSAATYDQFHAFSDTDATPGESKNNSRSHSPAKSDSELDKRGKDVSLDLDDEEKPEWKWGQLPDKTPTQEQPPSAIPTPGTDSKSASGWNFLGLGQFMRKTKNQRHMTEGIYLEDLMKSDARNVDPELAALYFPKQRTTSGESNAAGTSRAGNVEDAGSRVETPRLPSGPDDQGYASNSSSVLGDPGHASSLDDSSRLNDLLADLSMSKYGPLEEGKDIDEERFNANIVSYESFSEDPNVIFDPSLAVKLSGKYMSGKEALPSLISLLVFQRPLNQEANKLSNQQDAAQTPERKSSDRPPSASGVSSWFYWRRAASTDPTPISPIQLESTTGQMGSDLSDVTQPSPQSLTDMDTLRTPEDLSVMVDNKRYRKTLRLTAEQLKSLNLHRGQNEMRFSVTTRMQGTAFCTCNIYLWRWDDKIVISDIDGTITKSDVLGQILPVVGNQWAQAGVASLYNRIASNGYKLVYLSARAIGQSSLTKNYLRSIRQDQLSLPHGPLLLSPTSLISAFHREVIEKNPEEFKKSCLNDILALFDKYNPFYAGFGNKINDVWAYQATGVPIGRIFTINHRGELKHELTKGFSSSYVNMSMDFVDHIFPPLTLHKPASNLPELTTTDELRSSFTAPEEFSSYTFWKTPEGIDTIDLDKFPAPETKPKVPAPQVTDRSKKPDPKS